MLSDFRQVMTILNFNYIVSHFPEPHIRFAQVRVSEPDNFFAKMNMSKMLKVKKFQTTF